MDEMTEEQEYLVVQKPTRALQWIHAALLTALVIGSVLVVAVASFLYIRGVEEEQTAQIFRNQNLVEGIAREQRVTTLLASRTQQSELESAQQQLRLLLCTLDPTPAHCAGVIKDAEKLSVAIDNLQKDIKRHVRDVRSEPPPPAPEPEPSSSPGPEPSPAPTPTTTTPAPSPSPHVGNSDQCPPHNPQCPDD